MTDSLNDKFTPDTVERVVYLLDTARKFVIDDNGPNWAEIANVVVGFAAATVTIVALILTWSRMKQDDEKLRQDLQDKAVELRILSAQVELMNASRRAQVEPRLFVSSVSGGPHDFTWTIRNDGEEARNIGLRGHEDVLKLRGLPPRPLAPGKTFVLRAPRTDLQNGAFQASLEFFFNDVDGRLYVQSGILFPRSQELHLDPLPVIVRDPFEFDPLDAPTEANAEDPEV